MKNLPSSLIDHKNTLVNFSNSLLAHYGAKTFHDTIPELDAALYGHRKIALFLFDGCGSEPLEKMKEDAPFWYGHVFHKMHSTNPPTTAAATTALLNAHFPIETGWLGWRLYQEDLGRAIDVFPNKDSLTRETIQGWNFSEKASYVRIDALLQEAGVNARCAFKGHINGENGHKSLRQMGKRAEKFFKKEGGEFLYSYWDEPDHLMHGNGVTHKKVRRHVHKIDRFIERFVKRNPDVLVLTIADHGLIDVHYEDLGKDPLLPTLLTRPMVIEGRTPSFFVKEGQQETFKEHFEKAFPDFALMSKEEVLASGFFGAGPVSPISLENIGDFVAVALGETLIYNKCEKEEHVILKAHHAGGTEGELSISIGLYNQ